MGEWFVSMPDAVSVQSYQRILSLAIYGLRTQQKDRFSHHLFPCGEEVHPYFSLNAVPDKLSITIVDVPKLFSSK